MIQQPEVAVAELADDFLWRIAQLYMYIYIYIYVVNLRAEVPTDALPEGALLGIAIPRTD